MTKQKVLAVSAVLGIAALALSAGTLAYFTDTEKATNTFTIGNVDIELYESQLHRVNAGTTVAGRLSHDVTEFPMEGEAGSAPADSANWAGAYYTDEQIIADAQNYQSGYLAEVGQNLVPGANVMKAPYVKNVGSVDAYVRVRVLVPKTLDDGIIGNSMYTDSALGSSKLAVSTVSRNDVTYTQYAFTYNDPVKAGQMTFWNVWGDIKLSNNVTEKQIKELVDGGFLTEGGKFSVLVEADAIQATGFADAAAAFTAFDAQNQ